MNKLQMEYQNYLKEKKEVYDIVIQLIEDEGNDNSDYESLLKFNIFSNKEEISLFICLLVQIANYHHRSPNFFEKIGNIFQYFYNCIKTNFTNIEIFNLVKNNKMLVLSFIKQSIIIVDDEIVKEMKYRSLKTNTKYHYFFYPEIKKFLEKEELTKIEEELNFDTLTIFEDKRKSGENDSYLSLMIRNDSIDEFVPYINRANISISKTKILPSIFETNLYLIKNTPSLIEYAAFYGSIRIFQYLRLNNVEITENVWLYSIHSQNAELIHILETNSKSSLSYTKFFSESIKCHHNSIANYFQEIYLNEYNNEPYYEYVFHYRNFKYIPISKKYTDLVFFNMCRYNYTELIKLYLKSLRENLRNSNLYKDFELVYLQLSDSLNKEFSYEFQENTAFSQIAIPPNYTGIGNYAFNLCSLLTSVYIPSSVKYIGPFSFYKCMHLKKVHIPSSVTSIGDGAFEECNVLEKVSIPSSVKSIGNQAFWNCNSLKSIIIPSSLTIIEPKTFDGCSSLLQISFELPSSLMKIEKYAFNDCFSLEQISIPPSVKSIENCAFRRCKSLQQVIIPSSITSIEDNTFIECSSLKQVMIPSSVTSIGNYAFSDCVSLAEISIPSSVKLIGDKAFRNCPNLDDLNESDYDGDKKISPGGIPLIIFFCVTLLSLNSLILFIITVVWWSRIHPWFSHGYDSGKKVYILLEISWISILFSFFFAFLFYLSQKISRIKWSFFRRKLKLFKKIMRCINSIILIMLCCIFLTFTICSIWASIYALKFEKIEGKSVKCSKYMLSGYQGAFDWVSNQSLKKQNDLQNWHSKMLKKMYKKNGDVSNHYCLSIGVPTLLFAILPLATFLIFSIILNIY